MEWRTLRKRITVETVDFPLDRVRENPMSENSDKNEDNTTDFYNVGMKKPQAFASLASFVIGLILTAFLYLSGEFLLGFLTLVISFGWPLVLTEEGRKMYRKAKQDSYNQQQQQGNPTKSKKICSDCGWKNPHSNNFCIDCGKKLETRTE